MKQSLLESGQIVNTHGIRGEVKIVPWADSPDFLCGFSTLYIDGQPKAVRSAYVHKGNVIASLEGVDSIDAAILLKNKVISIAREDASLAPGQFFLADILGLEVRDAQTGQVLGKVAEVLTPPANHVYVIKGAHEFMVPAVPEFIVETNIEGGYLRIRLIEGMIDDV